MSQKNVEAVRNRLQGRWKDDRFEALDYIDAGFEFVLVPFCLVNSVTKPVFWLVFRVDEGKIVDWHSFANEEIARRAAKTGWSGPPHADS
jgi:hypothetical protein